jgi:hypothetical protein
VVCITPGSTRNYQPLIRKISVAAEPEDDDVKAERLEKLAAFQLVMIRHAMKCKRLIPVPLNICISRST